MKEAKNRAGLQLLSPDEEEGKWLGMGGHGTWPWQVACPPKQGILLSGKLVSYKGSPRWADLWSCVILLKLSLPSAQHAWQCVKVAGRWHRAAWCGLTGTSSILVQAAVSSVTVFWSEFASALLLWLFYISAKAQVGQWLGLVCIDRSSPVPWARSLGALCRLTVQYSVEW